MHYLIQAFLDRYPLDVVYEALVKTKRQEDARQAIPVFRPTTLRNNKGQIIAEITDIDQFPVLKLYTDDPILKAQAQAKLTANYFVDFYIHYVQFLTVAARAGSGKYFTDPVTFVADEIRRRRLDFSFIELELFYLLIEFNQEIAKYNESHSWSSSIKEFSMDDLMALVALCDIYKGIGCSAAVRRYYSEGKMTEELIRNLDWEPLKALGSHTFGILSPIRPVGPDKPSCVFSISFTPGILGLSMMNNVGLVVTLNEATTMETMRVNPAPGAIPQFILVRMILENCCSVAEVEAFLKKYQPASSHILTVTDAYGKAGVFEMLPNVGPNSHKLFHFHPLESEATLNPATLHVTNHFVHEGLGILGSEGFPCSFDRYGRMAEALNEGAAPFDVAASAQDDSTVHTMVVVRDREGLTVRFNGAEGFSATAKNSEGVFRPSVINLDKEFRDLEAKIVPLDQPLTANAFDQQLMKLFHNAPILGNQNPVLGRELSRLCSAIIHTMVKGNPESGREELIVNGLCRILKGELDSHSRRLAMSDLQYHINGNGAWTKVNPLCLILDKILIGVICGSALNSFLENGISWSFFNGLMMLEGVNPMLGMFLIAGACAALNFADTINRSIWGMSDVTLFGRRVFREIDRSQAVGETLSFSDEGSSPFPT
jgi:hypothetical protein